MSIDVNMPQNRLSIDNVDRSLKEAFRGNYPSGLAELISDFAVNLQENQGLYAAELATGLEAVEHFNDLIKKWRFLTPDSGDYSGEYKKHIQTLQKVRKASKEIVKKCKVHHIEPKNYYHFIEQFNGDVNGRNSKLQSPLNRAIELGNLDIVKLLVQSGAKVNEPDGRGIYPIRCALDNSNKEVLQLLKFLGVNLDAVGKEDPSMTALIYAVSKGDVDLVKVLLELGADVDKAGSKGRSALTIAKKMKRQDIVDCLLKQKSVGEGALVAEPETQEKAKSTGKASSREVSRKIRKNLKNLLDAVHRVGITATGLLPFSARGLIVNFLYSVLIIPVRLVQSIGDEFIKKFKSYVVSDWNWSRGIQDAYVDLENSRNSDLRRQVVEENLPYAAYIYPQDIFPSPEGWENGLSINYGQISRISSATHAAAISRILDALTSKLGFLFSPDGILYSLETGTVGHLIYDKKKNEIIFSILGLGSHQLLGIWGDGQGERVVAKESVKAALTDWFGGVPPSVRQAIAVGKLLKRITKDSGLNPVMIGLSHGGGLAQAGAVANGIKGVVFNSRPMGAGTRRYIGQLTVDKNAKNITAFSGKGDWLSGNKWITRLAVIFERILGIPVPRTVGQGYEMPVLKDDANSPLNSNSQHNGFYQELRMLKNMNVS